MEREQPKTELPQRSRDILEALESGVSVEGVSQQFCVDSGAVSRLLTSEEGIEYRVELRVRRSRSAVELSRTWDAMELVATKVLLEVLEDPEMGAAQKLTAAREVFDRHPGRRFMKSVREEKSVSGIRFDVEKEAALGRKMLAGMTSSAPKRVLLQSVGDISIGGENWWEVLK
jgi:hypothetical protein